MYSNDLISERLILTVDKDGSYTITESTSPRYSVGSRIAQSQLNTLLQEGIRVVMSEVQKNRFNENSGAPVDGSLLFG